MPVSLTLPTSATNRNPVTRSNLWTLSDVRTNVINRAGTNTFGYTQVDCGPFYLIQMRGIANKDIYEGAESDNAEHTDFANSPTFSDGRICFSSCMNLTQGGGGPNARPGTCGMISMHKNGKMQIHGGIGTVAGQSIFHAPMIIPKYKTAASISTYNVTLPASATSATTVQKTLTTKPDQGIALYSLQPSDPVFGPVATPNTGTNYIWKWGHWCLLVMNDMNVPNWGYSSDSGGRGNLITGHIAQVPAACAPKSVYSFPVWVRGNGYYSTAYVSLINNNNGLILSMPVQGNQAAGDRPNFQPQSISGCLLYPVAALESGETGYSNLTLPTSATNVSPVTQTLITSKFWTSQAQERTTINSVPMMTNGSFKTVYFSTSSNVNWYQANGSGWTQIGDVFGGMPNINALQDWRNLLLVAKPSLDRENSDNWVCPHSGRSRMAPWGIQIGKAGTVNRYAWTCQFGTLGNNGVRSGDSLYGFIVLPDRG